MFVTLYLLYRALAYIIWQSWCLVSLLLPFRLTVELVKNSGVFVTLTYHPTARQHVVVNIVTYTCVVIVLLHVAKIVLVGAKVPARGVQSNRALLMQTNESIEVARKGIERAKDDFKAMEETSAVTMEAFLEFRKVGENARGLYLTLEEMLDMLNQHVNRPRFGALPANSGGVR